MKYTRFRDLDISFEEALQRDDVVFDMLSLKVRAHLYGYTQAICEHHWYHQDEFEVVDNKLIAPKVRRDKVVFQLKGIYHTAETTKKLMKNMKELCTALRRTSKS